MNKKMSGKLFDLKLKEFFDYRKRYKNQRNKNKRLKKKVNKLSSGLVEELRLDVTNDEIIRLKREIKTLKNQVKNLSLQAQRYFDMLMDEINKQN